MGNIDISPPKINPKRSSEIYSLNNQENTLSVCHKFMLRTVCTARIMITCVLDAMDCTITTPPMTTDKNNLMEIGAIYEAGAVIESSQTDINTSQMIQQSRYVLKKYH